MRKEDVDKIVTAALQVANENALVYGVEIKKELKDKIIFRPDSYIKLATTPPTTTTPTSTTTTTPTSATTPIPTPSGASGLKKIVNTEWVKATNTKDMFAEFYKAVFDAYQGDNLKSIGFMKLDPSEDKPKELEATDILEFADKLEPQLRAIKYTLEFGVATVGQGERGGERILSLYDLILGGESLDFNMFPQYKLKTINALYQIAGKIRQQISRKVTPMSTMEQMRDFDKNSGWWNQLKGTLTGIKDSFIS